MMAKDRTMRNERGMALPVALMVLVVISLIAIVLMTTLQIETKIAGSSMRTSQALNTAEAGVSEALSRIRSGDVDDSGANPRLVAQIFNALAGDVPAVGADTIGLATAQPAGAWLDYSTASRSPSVLTVQYKTDPAKTMVYRYDAALTPPVQAISGNPIFVVTSTGRQGREVRRVVSEVIQRPVRSNIKGAVTAAVEVKFTGNAVVCGYNHRADTPENTGDNGRTGAGGCNEAPLIQHWEVGAGDKTGIWTTNAINNGGTADVHGTPATQTGQTGFYAGPWDALMMSQAEFYQWVGARLTDDPADLNGIFYLDDNGTTQDQSGNFGIHGGEGSGFLYVDGDLTLNAGFSYRGLVYVEGDLKLNGNAWILGGLIVRGKTQLKHNGAATVLYSHDAISQNLSKFGGTFVTLSWHEE